MQLIFIATHNVNILNNTCEHSPIYKANGHWLLDNQAELFPSYALKLFYVNLSAVLP